MLTTSLVFFIAFKERLSIKHMIGMICVVMSIVMIGFANSNREKSSIQTSENLMSPIVPLLLALCFCFIIAISSLIARLVIKRGRMSSLQFSADAMITQNVIFTIGAYLHHFHNSTPYSTRELYCCVIGSVVACIAVIFLNGALTYGKAGPCQALVQL